MPFRHLLFNRRNGAPQRAPDQQPISLESQRYFSLENEFPRASYNNAGWSDANDYSAHQQVTYNTGAVMHETHSQYAKQHHSPYTHPFDQSSMFPYNTTNGVPNQMLPYDFDSQSLQYSSDNMMDTDVSSISQGSMHSSISSASHVDVMFDDDSTSLSSLSRKPSVISNFSSDHHDEKLCPLITGQVAKCSPDLCGPSAPCLQYVNDDGSVPPIEECVPNRNQPTVDEMIDQPIDFTTPHHSPQRPRQTQQQAHQLPGVNPAEITTKSESLPQTEDEKKTRLRTKRSATKAPTTEKEPATKQTKKSRARQAHSLVERKYRENLNAKIQELHLTLRRVSSGKPCSHVMSSQQTHDDDDDEDDMDRSGSSKVKKSDVLIEAMNYVHATELELKRKDEEITQLSDRIKMMENWMRNTSLNQRAMM